MLSEKRWLQADLLSASTGISKVTLSLYLVRQSYVPERIIFGPATRCSSNTPDLSTPHFRFGQSVPGHEGFRNPSEFRAFRSVHCFETYGAGNTFNGKNSISLLDGLNSARNDLNDGKSDISPQWLIAGASPAGGCLLTFFSERHGESICHRRFFPVEEKAFPGRLFQQ